MHSLFVSKFQKLTVGVPQIHFITDDTTTTTTTVLCSPPPELVLDHPGELAPERLNQKGKTNLDLLEQDRVSGSGISWAIRKSAPRPRQKTTPCNEQELCL